MNSSFTFQLPSGPKAENLDTAFSSLSASAEWGQFSVAVAYSSLAGVARLHEIVYAARPNVSFRWLLGLDDYVTQPGAIDFCCSLTNTEVRIYQSKKVRTRFHPKVFFFDSLQREVNSSMVIGSANLTFSALNKNCEAVAVLTAQSAVDRQSLRSGYEKLWGLGSMPTAAILDAYRRKFDNFQKTRSFLLDADAEKVKNTGPILKSDAALVNPGTAKICWIAVGKNTAMGRELELKGEQARFFGLEPTGGAAETRDFKVSDGNTVALRLKYQGNAMWRLQLRQEVPEVATGLRPKVDGKLGRSKYVAVIQRTDKSTLFILSFLLRDSKEFTEIRLRSEKLGTIGSTSSREYGWY